MALLLSLVLAMLWSEHTTLPLLAAHAHHHAQDHHCHDHLRSPHPHPHPLSYVSVLQHLLLPAPPGFLTASLLTLRGGGDERGARNETARRQGGGQKPKQRQGGRSLKYAGDAEVYEGFLDQEVLVEVEGGREYMGYLRSFDALGNMVLDNATELVYEGQHEEDEGIFKSIDPEVWRGKTNYLGSCFVHGKSVLALALTQGSRDIENPFPEHEHPDIATADDDGDEVLPPLLSSLLSSPLRPPPLLAPLLAPSPPSSPRSLSPRHGLRRRQARAHQGAGGVSGLRGGESLDGERFEPAGDSERRQGRCREEEHAESGNGCQDKRRGGGTQDWEQENEEEKETQDKEAGGSEAAAGGGQERRRRRGGGGGGR
eukprot:650106-Hanusia_phi.AAC.2